MLFERGVILAVVEEVIRKRALRVEVLRIGIDRLAICIDRLLVLLLLLIREAERRLQLRRPLGFRDVLKQLRRALVITLFVV